MDVEILAARTRMAVVDESVRIETQPEGYRRVFRGKAALADDDIGSMGRCASFVLQVRDIRPIPVTVAVIGGGLCIIPRLLGPEFDVAVYEIEPALASLCPEWARFVPGDWRDTYKGGADVVIFDTGEELTVLDENRLGAKWLLR